MIQWSVAKPVIDPDSTPLTDGDYIAAIGGEGRNYACLFKAMESLKQIRLIVVSTSKSLEGLEIPDNVKVFTDIPYDEAINLGSL